jgi:hypothetical protein
MISNAIASEMGRILKVAEEHVVEDKAGQTCALKLWCCHPSDDRAECLGEVGFDAAEDGQAALFAPEDSFDADALKQAEYIELTCNGEEPVLRKNPDYAPTDEHHDEGPLEIVLVKSDADCSDADDGKVEKGVSFEGFANLMQTVTKIAAKLDEVQSPLTVKADQALAFTLNLCRKVIKEGMDKRDYSNAFGGLPKGSVVNESKRTVSIPVSDEDEEGEYEEMVELPYRYVICEVCEGHGTHVNPSVDRDGITESERAEMDPEEWSAYRGGAYDQTCNTCGGSGKAVDFDREKMTPEQIKFLTKHEEDQYEFAKMDREDARTRRMESGGY